MIDPHAPEKKVKDEVKKLLKKHGAWWYMVVPGGYGKQTVDFHVCHKGRPLIIETKKEGKTEVTPRQAEELESFAAAGGMTMIINARNLFLLEEWLDA